MCYDSFCPIEFAPFLTGAVKTQTQHKLIALAVFFGGYSQNRSRANITLEMLVCLCDKLVITLHLDLFSVTRFKGKYFTVGATKCSRVPQLAVDLCLKGCVMDLTQIRAVTI